MNLKIFTVAAFVSTFLFTQTYHNLTSASSDKKGSQRTADSTKSGWWIRINTSKTEASQISFQIGTDGGNRKFWRNWNSGDASEFDVPVEDRNVSDLYINASASPEDKNAWFCMMYKTRGVKHFDFDDTEEHKENQNGHDEDCD